LHPSQVHLISQALLTISLHSIIHLTSSQNPKPISTMLPPIKIPVPSGTKAIYLTAISLWKETSTVTVSWGGVPEGSATFGATFVGPNASYVLGDNVFGLPVIDATGATELTVSFNFNDDVPNQHSVSGPHTTTVGPEGDATKVQISGYSAHDKAKKEPTTLTILFQGTLHGLLPPAATA
jgi:hypothetical protein